jgi:hypothetical protein
MGSLGSCGRLREGAARTLDLRVLSQRTHLHPRESAHPPDPHAPESGTAITAGRLLVGAGFASRPVRQVRYQPVQTKLAVPEKFLVDRRRMRVCA